MNKYFSEAFGTFTLVLVVALSVAGKFPIPTPFLAAMVLGTFVYTVGSVSGAHLNPAVTIGLWTIGKIELKEAAVYIISQFLGALLAISVVSYSLGTSLTQGQTNNWVFGLAELIGTALLTFGVATVIFGKTDKLISGLVVGSSLFIGIAASGGMGSAGSLNPAVSLGLGLFNPIYVISEIVGGILGFWIYKIILNNKLSSK